MWRAPKKILLRRPPGGGGPAPLVSPGAAGNLHSLKSPVGLGHPPFRWVRSDGLLQVPKTAPPPLLSKGRDGPYSVTFDVCCCIALGFAKAGTTWFFTVEFFIGFFLNNPIIWGPAKSSFIQFYYKQIEIIGSRAQCPLMVVLEYVWWQLE